ncbi:MAG: glucose 1-dehydrogenase [Pseudomonadota bacterium]
MAGRLEGKVAIITGAARGQGAAEARAFVAEGAKVVITDVLPEVDDVARELGDAAIAFRHDVSDEAQWQAVAKAAIDTFGKIDVLVNNAGIFKPGTMMETTRDQFVSHTTVNQLGVFLGMKSVTEAMIANGGGSIVNIGSGAGQRGYPGIFAYLASKWAVTGMTKAAARELAGHKIRVNSVHPGLIATPMIAGPEGGVDFMQETAKTVPLGRIGTTDDVVAVVLHLASDASSYSTGGEFTMDGGTGL